MKKSHPASEDHLKLLQDTEAELESLKKELEEAKRKAAEFEKEAAEGKDKLLRACADFDNAKKRLAKEREEFVRFSNETILRGLLPILDNFERAIAHTEAPSAAPEEKKSALLEGLVLMKKQMADFLGRHGLTRVESLGKKFDPHVHESLGYLESAEHPEDTVLEEMEAGYLLHGRLLRPAKVRIAKKQEQQPEPGQ